MSAVADSRGDNSRSFQFHYLEERLVGDTKCSSVEHAIHTSTSAGYDYGFL